MADQIGTPAAEGIAARRAAVVSCWLCGTRLQDNQMVADGGSACSDVRWYCRDTRACTERWTTAGRQARAAGASPGVALSQPLHPVSEASRPPARPSSLPSRDRSAR